MSQTESQRYPHCEFPLNNTEQISKFIGDRLNTRSPTSLIRLGDGEGAVLARPTPENKTLWSNMISHFGHDVTPEFVSLLADQLIVAINTADVIGIRDDLLNVKFSKLSFSLGKSKFTEQFRMRFNLRTVEKNINYAGALRLALMHKFLANHTFRSGVIFGSAWMHFGLSQSGDLIRMIANEQQIGLISSKPTLAEQLQSLLNIKVDYYGIPDRYLELRKNEDYDVANQLTVKLAQMLDSLKVNFHGQLFLVGAGIIGKIYCHRIKELGGVAIDIGSVCDAWVGVPSRPLVFQTLFKDSDNQVPEALLLKHQVEGL